MKRKLWLVSLTALTCAASFAAGPNSTSSTLGSGGPAGSSSKSAAPQQRNSYQEAGDSGQEGANAGMASAAVHGGVAVVCGVACAATKTGYGAALENVCTGSNLAGAAANATISQDLSGALQSIMGTNPQQLGNLMGMGGNAAGSGASNGASSGASNGASSSGNNGSGASCMTAATSTLQSLAKAQGAQNSANAASANDGFAQNLDSNAPVVAADNGLASPKPQFGGLPGLGNGKPPGGGNTALNASGSDSPCRGDVKSSYDKMIACAISKDPSLPSFVTTPAFKESFEKIAGKPLNEYFSGGGSTGPGIAAGMAAGAKLGMDKAETLAKTIAKAEASLLGKDAGAGVYASAGGGGGKKSGGSSEDGPDFNALMKAALEQMNPNKGEEKPSPGVTAVEFALRSRSPASLDEDRALSIFDRVTYRYTNVARRWATVDSAQSSATP